MTALTRAGSGTAGPGRQPELLVDDHLEPRVRIPADLLRSIIAAVEIAILVGVAVLASATTTGVEFDLVGASRRLPMSLLHLVGFAGYIALLILPLALAVRLALLRQFRRLAEAIATGGIAVGFVALVNLLLSQPELHKLHAALHTTSDVVAGLSREAALDGALAGLVAYVTVIGLRGRAHWRSAFLTAIGFYAIASLADSAATVFSLLITVLVGSAVGSGLRYALGTISGRPSAAEIAAALSTPQSPVVAIRRVGNGNSEIRKYAVSTSDGRALDVLVFDRDQQAADAFYRLYQRLRLRASVSRSAPLSMEGAIERQALLVYATEDSGVRTPRLQAVTRVGPDAAAIATDHVEGTTLAEFGTTATDDQIRKVWDTVLRLHKHRVTHRALTADRIMFLAPDGRADHDGEVVLLDPGNGDVAATDLQSRIDLAQLIAQTALLVGPDRAADVAIEKVRRNEIPSLIPLLQPVVLYRSTRSALRGRKNLLADVRKRLLAAAPDIAVQPVQLERIRPRTLITLIAGVFAAYLLAGQLADVSLSQLIAHANPAWSLVALALSATTYVGATLALSGFVLERLNWLRTFLVQVASSFVILVTPAAVGGVALNVRYLRRQQVSAADAAASVGVTQAISFLLYAVLVLISVAVTGSSHTKALRPPEWAYIALAALVVIVLILLALPAGRRLLLARISSAVGQVVPRLLDVAQRPARLAEGVGGSLLMSIAYILCLTASVYAVGDMRVPVASIAVVYLTGSAFGSIMPTPGGLGAVETAMSTGLIAAGLPGATAITAVLLFRTFTFWLPVPAGWLALHYLQRHDVL
ncbi:MAG TPA: lysylphosphatidylglycerol synthase domain-containing protein [Streptosporangiaceae bacterium]|nr:lysylphosphatidylglycerol synthase domain-containing protein [Streptosporangiaceae bacterium]